MDKKSYIKKFYSRRGEWVVLTLTCAKGRFRPCLPILQNPQQFSDELQNYTLHKHTAHSADLHRRYKHTI